MQPASVLKHDGRRAVLKRLAGWGGGVSLLALGGCASWFKRDGAPLLGLGPASLGRELSLVQRMEIEARGQMRVFDAALEVDADEVRLAVMHLGQTIARLGWDGHRLTEDLAPGWPRVVSAREVLNDLQYVWWPAAQLVAALPPGWTLADSANRRLLRHGDNEILDVRATRAGVIELRHLDAGYLVRLYTLGAQPPFVSP